MAEGATGSTEGKNEFIHAVEQGSDAEFTTNLEGLTNDEAEVRKKTLSQLEALKVKITPKKEGEAPELKLTEGMINAVDTKQFSVSQEKVKLEDEKLQLEKQDIDQNISDLSSRHSKILEKISDLEKAQTLLQEIAEKSKQGKPSALDAAKKNLTPEAVKQKIDTLKESGPMVLKVNMAIATVSSVIQRYVPPSLQQFVNVQSLLGDYVWGKLASFKEGPLKSIGEKALVANDFRRRLAELQTNIAKANNSVPGKKIQLAKEDESIYNIVDDKNIDISAEGLVRLANSPLYNDKPIMLVTVQALGRIKDLDTIEQRAKQQEMIAKENTKKEQLQQDLSEKLDTPIQIADTGTPKAEKKGDAWQVNLEKLEKPADGSADEKVLFAAKNVDEEALSTVKKIEVAAEGNPQIAAGKLTIAQDTSADAIKTLGAVDETFKNEKVTQVKTIEVDNSLPHNKIARFNRNDKTLKVSAIEGLADSDMTSLASAVKHTEKDTSQFEYTDDGWKESSLPKSQTA